MRDQAVERQQQLPQPLTFRLVNPGNGRIVFAGIREFSARDNAVGLSPFLRDTLGIGNAETLENSISQEHASTSGGSHSGEVEGAASRLTVHLQELPKGTYIRLRPLEAGYDAEDWKALLEQYLRDTFTTLTNGEVITIPAGKEIFRFLVDGVKPNEEAISIVDTDLEVDIEPLNEEQARETLQRLSQKSLQAPTTREGSSAGGKIQFDSDEAGQVRSGEYVDYTVERWDATRGLVLELSSLDEEKGVDIFVTPLGPRHRGRPREEAYVFGDFSPNMTKRVIIRHTNAELENVEALWVSVRGYTELDEDLPLSQSPVQYHLRISSIDESSDSKDQVTGPDQFPLAVDEERCTNCHQPVPKQTMLLHQNFCQRNNILCPNCNLVFQKSSSQWKSHWHCPHDDTHGNTPSSKAKHDFLMHTPRSCPSCSYGAANVPDLAYHRTTACPAKLILCQFCHLQVPQQGPDDPPPESAEVILSGLTPHELTDGARTTECHLCVKIVRLRDMTTHLKHHDLQRLSRLTPKMCRNVNCGRTIDGASKNGEVRLHSPRNDLYLCDTCFGPFYVSMYDPDGKALKRRVERKYLTQLLSGCNQHWCQNEYCKTGFKNLNPGTEMPSLSSKDALSTVKPFLEGLKEGKTPVHFCTDEVSQRRRTLGEMLAAEGASGGVPVNGKGKGKEEGSGGGGYELEWCVAALEVELGNLDRARGWLKGFAPTRAEARR